MPYRNGKVVAWSKQIDIKKLLDDVPEDHGEEDLRDAATAICDLLETNGVDLDDISLGFRDDFVEVGSTHVDEFDYYLNELYDWADVELVWLGPC